MTDHRVPSQQANPVPANTYPPSRSESPPVTRPGATYCVSYCSQSSFIHACPCPPLEPSGWLVMTSKTSIGRASRCQSQREVWLCQCQVKYSIHDTSTRPNYRVGHYHPPPPGCSKAIIVKCGADSSDCVPAHSIRRFHMRTCLGKSKLPKLSQHKHKHTRLLQ